MFRLILNAYHRYFANVYYAEWANGKNCNEVKHAMFGAHMRHASQIK